tara:strand:- start:2130 stop:3761 length:1632 start_codon:yes stop_codon:yes gene_type:complete
MSLKKKLTLKMIEHNGSVVSTVGAVAATTKVDDTGIIIDFSGIESALDTEEARAAAAEVVNADAITALAALRVSRHADQLNAAMAREAAIQLNVDQNEADADAAIAALQVDVDQNEADSDAAEATLTANLTAEAATARAAEGVNAAAAALASSDLASYETSNDLALGAQVSKQAADELARTAAIVAAKSAADALLVSAKATADAKVELEEGRIDAILLASDADKDSFAEIVTLINDVDTVNDNALAVVIGNLNTEIAATNADITAAATDRGLVRSEFAAADVSAAAFDLAARNAIIAQHGADDGAAATDRGLVRSEFAAADVSAAAFDLAARNAIIAQHGADDGAAATDRGLVRSEFAAADVSAAAFDLAARNAIIAQHGADDGAAATDRGLIRSEFAAADAAAAATAAAATAAVRTMNFYKEITVLAANDVTFAGSSEYIVFEASGNAINNGMENGVQKTKMTTGIAKTGSDWLMPDGLGGTFQDFSKMMVYMNGVALQSGSSLTDSDYILDTSNPAFAVEIKFSEGLLEAGDVIVIWASFV